MGNNERVDSLARRLFERLDTDADGDKVVWLVKHLEQYLERWLGFAQSGRVGVAATLRNETFFVVLAAVEVANKILDQSGCTMPFPQEDWDAFCDALGRVQETPDETRASVVRTSFERFVTRLTNGE